METKDLKCLSNLELISRTEKLVASERKVTHLVLVYLCAIEDRRLYLQRGYDGMYAYLTQGLGYSESGAYRRLQSARLLREIPEAAKSLESGSLNLSQMTQVQKELKVQAQKGRAFSLEQTKDLLKKLENQNTHETKKTLALEFDHPPQTHEKVRPQKDNSIRLETTLTPEQFEALKQAKSLLSHACPDGAWNNVIGSLAKDFNSRKLGGARTPKEPRAEISTQGFGASKKQSGAPAREHIRITTKRDLFRKAQNRCEYVDRMTQNRCSSTYQLEVEHIRPLALGGDNSPRNLRILCRAHNNHMARQSGLRTSRPI